MSIALELSDAAIGTLDAATRDEPAPDMRLTNSMKLYALERLSSRVAAESVGNGRIEFLDRLAKFGARFSEETAGDLALGRGRLRSIFA